jgi:hypothetical protein
VWPQKAQRPGASGAWKKSRYITASSTIQNTSPMLKREPRQLQRRLHAAQRFDDVATGMNRRVEMLHLRVGMVDPALIVISVSSQHQPSTLAAPPLRATPSRMPIEMDTSSSSGCAARHAPHPDDTTI